jgi:hypothetical protein
MYGSKTRSDGLSCGSIFGRVIFRSFVLSFPFFPSFLSGSAG